MNPNFYKGNRLYYHGLKRKPDRYDLIKNNFILKYYNYFKTNSEAFGE